MGISDLMKKVAEKGPDQSQVSAGGGYTPPEAGFTVARLVGYFETGQHEEEWEGVKKVQNKVKLVFELLGKKHAPKEVNGEKIPIRMTLELTLSQSDRAWYFKIFSKLRTDETHMIQLLGKPLAFKVVHVPKKNGKPGEVFARIDKDSINKAIQLLQDEESGEIVEKPYNVPPALTELKAFVWDFADEEMWDSLYIPGEWEERKDDKGNVTAPARSKNVLQLEIASALNFKALGIYDYAKSKLDGGEPLDTKALDEAVGDVEEAPAKDDDAPPFDEDDPMAGIE